MSDEDYKRLWERAKALATKKGFYNDAEDFAQECVIKYLKTKKINLYWAFVDFLRAKYGNPRHKGFKSKKALTINIVSLDDPTRNQTSDLKQMLKSYDYIDELSQYNVKFTARQKQVHDLYFYFDMSQAEISRYLKISEVRVFYLIRTICDKYVEAIEIIKKECS